MEKPIASRASVRIVHAPCASEVRLSNVSVGSVTRAGTRGATGGAALKRESAAATSPGRRLINLFSDSAFSHRHCKRSEYLFRAGTKFQSVHVLANGHARSCYFSEEGREQTTGLHLPGDVLGLDGLADGTHWSGAVALDDCEVIAIPYAVLIAQSHRDPALVQELYRAFGAEIQSFRALMLNMRTLHATARVGAFVLEMSRRFEQRGLSPTHFELHLTRQEVGSMLGLEMETVSRAFSRFAELGLITIYLRDVVLLDIDGLRALVERRDASHVTEKNGAVHSPRQVKHAFSPVIAG
ncbi:MAG: helix-turn-helix domain-containing protein [Usitatibacteraceae bacterium]